MVSSFLQWQMFCQKCREKRVDIDLFSKLAKALAVRCPINGLGVASLFLRPSDKEVSISDPRVPSYIEKLLELGLTNVSDVLKALIKFSSFGQLAADLDTSDSDQRQDFNSSELEAIIIFRVSRAIIAGSHPKDQDEGIAILNAAALWTIDFATAMSSINDMKDSSHASESSRQGISEIQTSTGMLLVTVCDSNRVGGLIARSAPMELKSRFNKALSAYTTSSEAALPQICSRLEEFRLQHTQIDEIQKSANGAIEEAIAKAAVDTTHIPGLESINIMEGPVINSRAGLYIYLNALLVGRPILDDNSLLSYLHTRYKSNISMLATDLITASFDVLANSMFRKEPTQFSLIPRSFLINKVPILLANLSPAMYPTTTPEYCISQALKFVDHRAFPSFSSMFDQDNDIGMFSDVRQDFLFACCLHELLPQSNIEELLGEPPMQTLPQGGKYVKEDLVIQFLAEPDKIETYLGELEEMSGNVGAVAGAIGEVIISMCNSRDTMSLKSICVALARKPASIDILLLFNTVSAVLRPLCILLDGWRYDDDQGEHQPIYEEFGNILLLVLAFVHRYELTAKELGLSAQDSFLLRLLDNSTDFRQMTDLAKDESKNLEGWLVGMYKDGQISDDLVSSCTPQQFYHLIPTLFYQTLLACNTGKLNNERLKGGLEYLLEPFLLPSLVKTFTWFSTYIWQQHPDPDLTNTLRILGILTKPVSSSTEAASIHSAILAMTAKPLEIHLRALQSSGLGRERKDIEPIIQVLQQIPSFKRTTTSPKSERSSWTLISGGLRASLRQTIQAQVHWSANPDGGVASALYTHRQLILARDMLGCQAVIATFVDELKSQSESSAGLGDIALDVIATMISAPIESAGNHGIMSLREGLRLEAEDAPKLLATDTARAEATIKLHRRVEAQLAPSTLLVAADVNAMVSNGLQPDIKMDEDVDISVENGDLENMMAVAMDDTDVFMDDMGLGGGIMDIE